MDELIARYAKLPARQRLLGFAGIVVLLLIGHWFLVYGPQSEELEQLKAEHIRLETERQAKDEYIGNLATYEARFNELQNDLEKKRAELPDDPDVPNLLSQ